MDKSGMGSGKKGRGISGYGSDTLYCAVKMKMF